MPRAPSCFFIVHDGPHALSWSEDLQSSGNDIREFILLTSCSGESPTAEQDKDGPRAPSLDLPSKKTSTSNVPSMIPRNGPCAPLRWTHSSANVTGLIQQGGLDAALGKTSKSQVYTGGFNAILDNTCNSSVLSGDDITEQGVNINSICINFVTIFFIKTL